MGYWENEKLYNFIIYKVDKIKHKIVANDVVLVFYFFRKILKTKNFIDGELI